MLPLHGKITANSKFNRGHPGGVLDIKFDELASLVFRDVGPILLEIYQVYFSHEVKGNQGGMLEETMWKINEKSVFEFMKEYDICPSLLSKSAAHQVYQHTKDAREPVYQSTGLDILKVLASRQVGQGAKRPGHGQAPSDTAQSRKAGRFFTFFKLLEVLVKCAKMTFSGYSTGAESQIYSSYRGQGLLDAEMLCLLLERMELSRGFNNLEKRTNRPHTATITLLPSRQVVRSLAAAKQFLQGNEEEAGTPAVDARERQSPAALRQGSPRARSGRQSPSGVTPRQGSPRRSNSPGGQHTKERASMTA